MKVMLRLLVCLLLAGTAHAGFMTAQSTEITNCPTNVSNGFEPDVTVSPTSVGNVVWGAQECDRWTTDGGGTNNTDWSASTTPSAATFDPQFKFDASGTVHKSGIVFGTGNSSEAIFLQHSGDGGNTWANDWFAMHDTEAVTNGPDPQGDHICQISTQNGIPIDYDKLGVDRFSGSPHANTLYVTATVALADNSQPPGACPNNAVEWRVVASSTDGGLHWTTPEVIYDEVNFPGTAGASDIAVDPSGAALVVFPGTAVGCTNGLEVMNVNTSATSCAINNPSGTGQYPLTGLLQGSARIAADPITAGTWYVLFPGYRYWNISQDDLHMWLVHTTDSGAHWSAPVKVDSDPFGNKTSPLGNKGLKSSISVSDGPNAPHRVDMIWIDQRNASTDPSHAAQADVYYNYSGDSGRTVGSTDVRLTPVILEYMWGEDSGKFVGDYISIASHDNVAYAAYDSEDINKVRHSIVNRITTTLP